MKTGALVRPTYQMKMMVELRRQIRNSLNAGQNPEGLVADIEANTVRKIKALRLFVALVVLFVWVIWNSDRAVTIDLPYVKGVDLPVGALCLAVGYAYTRLVYLAVDATCLRSAAAFARRFNRGAREGFLLGYLLSGRFQFAPHFLQAFRRGEWAVSFALLKIPGLMSGVFGVVVVAYVPFKSISLLYCDLGWLNLAFAVGTLCFFLVGTVFAIGFLAPHGRRLWSGPLIVKTPATH